MGRKAANFIKFLLKYGSMKIKKTVSLNASSFFEQWGHKFPDTFYCYCKNSKARKKIYFTRKPGFFFFFFSSREKYFVGLSYKMKF